MRNFGTGKYTRVRKDVARRLYGEGKTIYLTPSNVAANDSNFWVKPLPISLEERSKRYHIPVDHSDLNFNQRVNEFEYYNCNYELGYYTNFWINEEEEK